MKIEVGVHAGGPWRSVKAPVDSGPDVSTVNHLFAKECGLERTEPGPRQVKGINGKGVPVYGAVTTLV